MYLFIYIAHNNYIIMKFNHIIIIFITCYPNSIYQAGIQTFNKILKNKKNLQKHHMINFPILQLFLIFENYALQRQVSRS